MGKNGAFIKRYKKKMVSIIKQMEPSLSEDEIKDIVQEMIDKNLQNPEVIADNNVTGERRETTLLSVLDWAYERPEKPIFAGNFTFYKNQDEAFNPIGSMLNGFLTKRKSLKKKMFNSIETPHLYQYYDRSQINVKKLANSYYGAAGMPTSPFYSLYSGPATTSSAQMAISTAMNLFEGLVADNYIFIDCTECVEWIHEMLLPDNFDGFVDDFITMHSDREVVERLLDHILEKQDNDEEVLYAVISELSDDELTLLYYKNNIFDFIKDNSFIQNLLLDIFESIENLDYADPNDKDWYIKIPKEYQSEFLGKSAGDYNKFVNKTYFMDPNDVPENIERPLSLFTDYCIKFVYCRYMAFDRIYRLRNFKRKTVTIIDTDSNILSLDTLINFIYDNVVEDRTFNRSKENNDFIAVNTVTYLLTKAVADGLENYSKKANMSEAYQHHISMKNEFYFGKLLIGDSKKRYLSKIVLREGNLINPPKFDIKGLTEKSRPLIEKSILNNKVNCWELPWDNQQPRLFIKSKVQRLSRNGVHCKLLTMEMPCIPCG